MASKDNPVLAELDSIAQDLEKTGNADLATLVDECSAAIISGPKKTASTKKSKKKTRRSKKNRKSAGSERSSRRQRVAATMRKIARAQVSELEDIAAELLRDGEKTAALEVLRIAEDLDSDYEYSTHGAHDAPESKGDADKRYEKKKNQPKTKGDDAKTEDPYEEGEGYPFNEKQSAFDKQLDELLRLAMEESEEDDEDEDEEHDDEMKEDEEADDELAEMMKALSDDKDAGMDHEAGDRMYEADDDMGMDMDMGDDADDLDLGGLDLDDEGGADDEDMDLDMGGEDDDEDEDEDMDLDMGDKPDMDEDKDTEGLLGFEMGVDTPVGGIHLGSADKKQMLALAKKLNANGQKKLAQRVVSLLKKAK